MVQIEIVLHTLCNSPLFCILAKRKAEISSFPCSSLHTFCYFVWWWPQPLFNLLRLLSNIQHTLQPCSIRRAPKYWTLLETLCLMYFDYSIRPFANMTHFTRADSTLCHPDSFWYCCLASLEKKVCRKAEEQGICLVVLVIRTQASISMSAQTLSSRSAIAS